MDPCLTLYYPEQAINRKMYLEEYFSQSVPFSTFKESTINMQRCFYKAFSSGLVSGKTLIDISLGPIIMHLISVCEFLQEILMLKLNNASIMELELWKNKDPKAFDRTQTSKLFMELKQLCSDGWEEQEEILRGKIKEI
ncbi:indolethylamine N-methyltransferase-like [Ranitomeya variabilis]|uniref:indolethylamine N-methyltransferase-like n=1 Tax=Ranitomeya variabilis TaxID=490064 RepID=UPI004056A7F8